MDNMYVSNIGSFVVNTASTLSAFVNKFDTGMNRQLSTSTIFVLTAVALATFSAIAMYMTASRSSPRQMNGNSSSSTLQITQRLAKEIVALKPTIGDAASYTFGASQDKKIQDEETKAGSLAMMAAAMTSTLKNTTANSRTYARPSTLRNAPKYKDDPEAIVKLGMSLLKTKSGQCDHMAAAVIAKIVLAIQQGEAWDSTVELIGNGGHAMTLIGRKEGSDIHNPKTWGSKTIMVDTWLACVGLNNDYKNEATTGTNGVLATEEEVQLNANFFDANRFSVTHTFTPEKLRDLAKRLA